MPSDQQSNQTVIYIISFGILLFFFVFTLLTSKKQQTKLEKK